MKVEPWVVVLPTELHQPIYRYLDQTTHFSIINTPPEHHRGDSTYLSDELMLYKTCSLWIVKRL